MKKVWIPLLLIAVLATGVGVARLARYPVGGHPLWTWLYDWQLRPTHVGKEAADLKAMCAHDYHFSIETRREGDNLQAFFWRVGLLNSTAVKSGQLDMKKEAADALEKVMLCATRVSLSTDARLKFVEIKMADVLTGSSVTLWRFIPDIRDSMYTRLPEEEYFNRLVVEFNSTTQDQNDKDWTELKWDPPITMQEFLAKQVVARAKNQKPGWIQAHEDVSTPGRLIVVVDNWNGLTKAKEEDLVTDVLEQTARTVMKGYAYKGFSELELQDSRGAAVKSLRF